MGLLNEGLEEQGRAILLMMADWCGPCQGMMRELVDDDPTREYLQANGISLVYVDAETNSAIARD